MATMSKFDPKEMYRVIHPLHDRQEQKCNSGQTGPMEMTPRVRRSLYLLRGYLLLMSGMLLYRVAEMAGLLHN